MLSLEVPFCDIEWFGPGILCDAGCLLVPDMKKCGHSKSLSMGPIMAGGNACGHHSSEHPCCYLRGSGRHIRWEAFACWFYSGIYTGRFLSSLYHYFMLSQSIPGSTGEAITSQSSLAKDFLIYVLPLSTIVLAVLGSIFTGVATPTEASALGALTSFILAACYKSLTPQMVIKSATSTLAISTMILMIVGGSVAFSQLLGFTGIVRGIVNLVTNLSLLVIIVVLMQLVLLIMGCFIDQIAIIMIAVPIFMPISNALGFDPVWMGLLMLISISLGLLTSPFGLLLFIMRGHVEGNNEWRMFIYL